MYINIFEQSLRNSFANHWNGDVVTLTKFSPLAAPEIGSCDYYRSTLVEYQQFILPIDREGLAPKQNTNIPETTHQYWGLKTTEVCNLKWSSKFVREYRVLHSMWGNSMSVFIKSISLCNLIKFLVILYPKSLANLVVEVGTRHSHQIPLSKQFPVPPMATF